MVGQLWRRNFVLPSFSCTSATNHRNDNKLINNIQIDAIHRWTFYVEGLHGTWTYGAVEALAVIIMWECFHPAIASFDWESACKTFRCEQFIPISFTVWTAIFQEELAVAKQFATICAVETFRMVVFANCIQTISLFWKTIKEINIRSFHLFLQYARKESQIICCFRFTLILPEHLSHGGAKNCSKQYSQYNSPFSSTKPISWSGRRQLPFTQTKCSGHQMRPNAVMNGPLIIRTKCD